MSPATVLELILQPPLQSGAVLSGNPINNLNSHHDARELEESTHRWTPHSSPRYDYWGMLWAQEGKKNEKKWKQDRSRKWRKQSHSNDTVEQSSRKRSSTSSSCSAWKTSPSWPNSKRTALSIRKKCCRSTQTRYCLWKNTTCRTGTGRSTTPCSWTKCTSCLLNELDSCQSQPFGRTYAEGTPSS